MFSNTLVSLLQVKLGPTFNFTIRGRCSAPSLEFSFTRHNFGQCLLFRPGMVLPSTALVISNTGKKDVGCVLVFTTLIHLPVSFRFTKVWFPLLNSSGDAVNVDVADEMLEVFLLLPNSAPLWPVPQHAKASLKSFRWCWRDFPPFFLSKVFSCPGSSRLFR